MYNTAINIHDTASSYTQKISQMVRDKYPWETEFIQAVDELLFSLAPVFSQEPLYQYERILERMVEPERVVIFRVPGATVAEPSR